MAGVYYIGVKAGLSDEEAIKTALAVVRETDQDELTADPVVIPAPDPDPEIEDDAPHPQVRVVVGMDDPRPMAEMMSAAADENATRQAEADRAVMAKLSALTPDHLAVLDRLVELMKASG